MLEQTQERLLMERTAEGDRRAFRAIFDSYYPVVLGFMGSLLHSSDDASDLAQEVFVKLWIMRAALPEISSLHSYIYRMSLNQTINYMKKKRLSPGGEELFADIPYDPLTEDFIDMKDKEAYIAAVVEKMPEQRRKVFVMSRLEHLSNDEIATTLNIRKKTVENHLNLALKELRAALPAAALLAFPFLF